ADNWKNIRVSENFNPHKVENNKFYGLIRIGEIDDIYLDFHDLHQPAGIYNSTIISCDIGSNVSINNVRYLSHYIIRDTVILSNIDEMVTTSYAKFGNGIIKENEDEDIRIKIEVCNENGNRAIMPYDGMVSADAFLWSKYRDDSELMEKFKEFTQTRYDDKRGYYGTVGEYTVIKNCRIIKDVKIGSHAYIKGCNKLKNLTINSESASSTQLGEGIELVNGVIGFGCRVFYGVKAIRFILSDYSTLKYGARLINSFLGSNSTISCCEVLNALIFPGHEQHHNNSFLCAATLLGQSNIASGATVGSNHNSRANDGEIVAGRGFWPGLCTSLKHNSLFSSFNLLAKGAYPAEINNPFPFSLLSNNEKEGELTIIPAYWFMYNLYALERNSWKYSVRDNRKNKKLDLELNYLAPDTVNEMLSAMTLIEKLILNDEEYKNSSFNNAEDYLISNRGKDLIVHNIENSKRKTRILKSGHAYCVYKDFILYYIIRNILEYCENTDKKVDEILSSLSADTIENWVSIGGQLIREKDLENIILSVKNGSVNSWESLHKIYLDLSEKYTALKIKHCISVYKQMFNQEPITGKKDKFQKLCHYIFEETFKSRQKDYFNEFRLSTYNSKEEMEEVMGKLEDNSFIQINKEEMEKLISLSEKYL
ncbi:MAG: DUF4954 family protein, partial [Spirochaetaceae bacterium]|nr:DUF4954 family protein [Spirochaetaceae bacterium]